MESSNVKVWEELKVINGKFAKLESDVGITRNTISLLSSYLIDAETQFWANVQYSRREMLEMKELPKSLKNKEAETKVCQNFQSWDCNVNKEDLDAFHWLKNKERVIVTFCQRKDCEKVSKAKNNIRKLSATNLDI